MGHTFHTGPKEYALMNDLTECQRLLISQKCQPPSSPRFPPPTYKINDAKSMLPMPSE